MSMSQEIGFIETDCAIELGGERYESGGAFIATNTKTGRLGGIMYESKKTGEITDWHGKLRIKAEYGPVWEGNMRDCHGFRIKNCTVCFEYKGKKFLGIWYNMDWRQDVKVHEVKA
jgi:hypothetical protein